MQKLNGYDWENVSVIDEKTDEPDYSIIPENNTIEEEIFISRTPIKTIDKTLWKDIKDYKVKDIRSKLDFVESYFSTCIYVLKKANSVSLSANEISISEVKISHVSSTRNSTTKHLGLSNTFESSISKSPGQNNAGVSSSLKNAFQIEYSITNIEEYYDEKQDNIMKSVTFDKSDRDRSIVIWDIVKIIPVYRKDVYGNVELIAVDDFLKESIKKTYHN